LEPFKTGRNSITAIEPTERPENSYGPVEKVWGFLDRAEVHPDFDRWHKQRAITQR
jgi:hypothetical protein